MKSLVIGGLSFGLCVSAVAQTVENESWLDQGRNAIHNSLNRWANSIDGWIDETDPNQPASATLRLIMDNEWNRDDGYSYKPRVRAKIRLPALKRKFSLVFGDEDLDNQSRDKNQLHRNYNKPLEENQKYDKQQTRSDNSSLAVRWSDRIKSLGIDTDLDLGLRSETDLFVRAKASRQWQWSDSFSSRVEQIYRFGVKSRHYIRTNIEQRFNENARRSLNNHTYYQYTHNTDQRKYWGNSTYRQHNYSGLKQLNYGFNFGGEVKHKRFNIHYYGPFINWRQPILRQWLFIQPEVNFYNDRPSKRKHRVGAFFRMEAVL